MATWTKYYVSANKTRGCDVWDGEYVGWTAQGQTVKIRTFSTNDIMIQVLLTCLLHQYFTKYQYK